METSISRRMVSLYVLVFSLLMLTVNAWLSWTRIRQVAASPKRHAISLPQLIYKEEVPLNKENPTWKGLNALSSSATPCCDRMSVRQAEESHGMPWKSSIDPAYEHEFLFFMPFWEWQLDFMKTHLRNLRVVPTVDRTQECNDLTYVENTKKKKRMITLCFESDEYRLIRLTYLDAGLATQVFTSLWYPRTNSPVLGIDFLQFNNATRHLTVVDMQPIHSCEDDHDIKYSHLLTPIRDCYPSLQYQMSKRFYDENQFFSSQMLLGRGEDGPDYVWKELFPAYKDYVMTHLGIVQQSLSCINNTEYAEVIRRHKAYDDYSSVRDPAHGLLKAIFGKEYADAFVYDVLFPLSDGQGYDAQSDDNHH